jgi:alcohol dehydrogenase class IV
MEDLLMNVAQTGVAFAVLVAAVIYFLGREKKKEAEIERLHQELRESEKESLTALYKTTALLEKMLEQDKTKNELLLKEIDLMRISIEAKIDSLK